MKKILVFGLLLMLCGTACARTLSLDDWNEDVKTAQQALIDAGYLSGVADGIYGKNTVKAVEQFQYLNGLEITGTIDDDDFALLTSGGFRTLRKALQGGDKGDEVTALQERLILLGFLSGKADGVYGDKTQRAVKDFQQHLHAQGITEDDVSGVATGLTQEYLFSPTYTTYVHDVQPGAEDDGEIFRVERALRDMGYMDASPDHVYDNYAVECVRAFQRSNGLEVNGVINRETVDRMFSAEAVGSEHVIPHDLKPGDSGQLVAEAQETLIRLGFLAGIPDGYYGDEMTAAVERLHAFLFRVRHECAEMFENSELLTVAAQDVLRAGNLYRYTGAVDGDSGKDDVRRVQRRLHSLFYLARTDLDGDFGKKTRTAIEEFQLNNGLEVTGYADAYTQRALYSDDAIGDWTPYKLEISIDDQRVYVFELGEDKKYVQIDEFICSTGLGTSTPLGVFTSTQPLNRWHFFKDFNCWAQYSYQIEGNILFHSILYDEQDTDTIRLNSVYALGSKASHGCVRLQPENAKWIYENCKRGTIVIIY